MRKALGKLRSGLPTYCSIHGLFSGLLPVLQTAWRPRFSDGFSAVRWIQVAAPVCWWWPAPPMSSRHGAVEAFTRFPLSVHPAPIHVPGHANPLSRWASSWLGPSVSANASPVSFSCRWRYCSPAIPLSQIRRRQRLAEACAPGRKTAGFQNPATEHGEFTRLALPKCAETRYLFLLDNYPANRPRL